MRNRQLNPLRNPDGAAGPHPHHWQPNALPIVRSIRTTESMVILTQVNAVDQFLCTNMSLATLS